MVKVPSIIKEVLMLVIIRGQIKIRYSLHHEDGRLRSQATEMSLLRTLKVILRAFKARKKMSRMRVLVMKMTMLVSMVMV